MDIKDLAGISKPLVRLIEVVSQGCGRVSAPYLMRKQAEADAHKIAVIAGEISKVSDGYGLTVRYLDEKIQIIPGGASRSFEVDVDQADRVAKRLEYQESARQENVESITSVAAFSLVDEAEVPESRPAQDWISRFFRAAEDISDCEMQVLWGRILAGEIVNPGSYSLRTLDIVRNLNSSEAETFQKVARFGVRMGGGTAVAGVMTFCLDWLKSEHEIFEMDHFVLSELGLMYPMGLSNSVLKEKRSDPVVMFLREKLALKIETTETSKPCRLAFWKFTAAGAELLRLVGDEVPEGYIDLIAKMLLEHNLKVTLLKILEEREDGYRVETIKVYGE